MFYRKFCALRYVVLAGVVLVALADSALAVPSDDLVAPGTGLLAFLESWWTKLAVVLIGLMILLSSFLGIMTGRMRWDRTYYTIVIVFTVVAGSAIFYWFS